VPLTLYTEWYVKHQPKYGQHQRLKHVVVIYVIKYLTYSNQLSCVRRTDRHILHLLFIMSGLRNHFFTSGRNRSLYPFIRRMIKRDRSNYRCVSFLSTTCRHLSGIFFLRLTPYAEEMAGDDRCGFGHN
jgi:hypothetical protein